MAIFGVVISRPYRGGRNLLNVWLCRACTFFGARGDSLWFLSFRVVCWMSVISVSVARAISLLAMITYWSHLVDIPACFGGLEKIFCVFDAFFRSDGDEIVAFVGCNGVDSWYW